jgi:beta-glucosidase
MSGGRREYAGGGGVIGITLNIDWAYPLDPASGADKAAAERRNEFTFSWFADPIFFGKYPLSMRQGAQER